MPYLHKFSHKSTSTLFFWDRLNSGGVGTCFSSFLLEEFVFVIRFCSAGPKKPLEIFGFLSSVGQER